MDRQSQMITFPVHSIKNVSKPIRISLLNQDTWNPNFIHQTLCFFHWQNLMNIFLICIPNDHKSCVQILSIKHFQCEMTISSFEIDNKCTIVLLLMNRVQRRATCFGETSVNCSIDWMTIRYCPEISNGVFKSLGWI